MSVSQLLEKALNRYNSNVFVHNPIPEFEPRETLHLLHESYTTNDLPFFTIVMPIHNQEAIIRKNLDALLTHTVGKPYEIILILDSCSDSTEDVVMTWIRETTFPELCVARCIFKSTLPLFECSADNLGFYCARGEYVLEIQADIHIVQTGYNMRLLRPFDYFENLLGVSGRCCYALANPECAGRASENIEYPLPPEFPRNVFYVSDTCIRGPLLLHRPKLVEMGFLDEANFFLDYSDHDLFIRARIEKGLCCGYTPVEYESPLEHGSTRKPRDPLNQEHYERRRSRLGGGKLGMYFERGIPYMPMQIFELDF